MRKLWKTRVKEFGGISLTLDRIFLNCYVATGLLLAAEPPIVPDDRLTPGVIATFDAEKVCRPNYSAGVRHTSQALKARVYRLYKLTNAPGSDFEVDHRVPLSLGGADVQRNLWPESYRTTPWNATVKDRLERYVHTRVCIQHTMTLLEGQRLFEGNWIVAYREYIGEP